MKLLPNNVLLCSNFKFIALKTLFKNVFYKQLMCNYIFNSFIKIENT